MKHSLQFILSVYFACAGLPGPAFGAPSWVIKARENSKLDHQKVDPSGRSATRVKWDEGYIEVKAIGHANPAIAFSSVHAKSMALEAARALAYAKLAESIEGVRVDGITLVKNALLKSQLVRTRVKAHIRNARVVREKSTATPGGGAFAEVSLGILLRGPNSLAENLAAFATRRPILRFKPHKMFRNYEKYTGVIVETSDTGFKPSMFPLFIEEKSNRVVYGPASVSKGTLKRLGLVGYAAKIKDKRIKKRVGKNPLIIRALRLAGKNGGDLILLKKDAERLLAANREGKFLSKAAAVIVISRPTKELIKKPGKKFAVVVGVSNYPKSSGDEFSHLDFAAKDAHAVANLLSLQAGYTKNRIKTLLNKTATRDGIASALRSLRIHAKEEDMVLFYFSGHGAMGKGKDGKSHYYLIPHNGRVDDLTSTSIQDYMLEELIGQIPARQIVVLLDTCYSGGAKGVLGAKGVTNKKFNISPPQRSFMDSAYGRVLISASRSNQVSFEAKKLGHGVFTGFLLKALSGQADKNSNGKVSVLEAYQFISKEVPEYTQEHFRREQTPVLEVRNLSQEIVLAQKK